MSKTPRTDEAWEKHATDDRTGFSIALGMRIEMIKLEAELADMRDRFAEYVKAEDAKELSIDLEYHKVASNVYKLRKQAKEVLGL